MELALVSGASFSLAEIRVHASVQEHRRRHHRIGERVLDIALRGHREMIEGDFYGLSACSSPVSASLHPTERGNRNTRTGLK